MSLSVFWGTAGNPTATEGFMALNDDDDNANGTNDLSDAGPVSGENELVPVTVQLTSQGLVNVGNLTFAAGGGVTLWTNEMKAGAAFPASTNWVLGTDPFYQVFAPHGLSATYTATFYAEGVTVSTYRGQVQCLAQYTPPVGPPMEPPALATGTVLKVEITDPNGNPIGDDQFVFQGLVGSRACEVSVSGSSGVPAQNADLAWNVDAIPDTTLTSEPTSAKGTNVTFTYTGESTSNSDFAVARQLTLSHALLPDCQDTTNLHFFFAANLVNTHGTGMNWFVYWKQDSVVSDLQTFEYANTTPGWSWTAGYYDTNSGVCYVTHDAYAWAGHESYQVTNSTGNVVTIGLDLGADWDGTNRLKAVAAVCAHELKHKEIHGWRSDDPVDSDDDGVPDARESALGLDPNTNDTYNIAGAIDPRYAGYGDEEFLARQVETNFGAITASKDWSCDGCNWRQ